MLFINIINSFANQDDTTIIEISSEIFVDLKYPGEIFFSGLFLYFSIFALEYAVPLHRIYDEMRVFRAAFTHDAGDETTCQ